MSSMGGMFLSNATTDFSFYHAHESTKPFFKHLPDEYLRLAHHHLPTIIIEQLIEAATAKTDSCCPAIIIANAYARSLKSASEISSTNSPALCADLPTIPETWTDAAAHLFINNFQMNNHQ